MSSATEILNKAGLRATDARLSLLALLEKSEGPRAVEELHRLLQRAGKSCDLATVYRTLLSLEKLGIVRRVEFDDHTARFEFSFRDHHHHHVMCRKCRQVACVEVCIPGSLTRTVSKLGYKQISHSLEFFGICNRCSV